MGLGLAPILQLELPTRLCRCFGMERVSYYLVLGRPSRLEDSFCDPEGRLPVVLHTQTRCVLGHIAQRVSWGGGGRLSGHRFSELFDNDHSIPATRLRVVLTSCHSSLSKPPPELRPGAKDVGRAADLYRAFWDIHGHVISVDVLRNQHVGSNFDASRSPSHRARGRVGTGLAEPGSEESWLAWCHKIRCPHEHLVVGRMDGRWRADGGLLRGVRPHR